MERFDWLDFCIPCKNWCCHDENPFASKEELAKLKTTKINTKSDGSCIFLDSSSICSVYKDRPFECRIFPFDIQEVGGRFFWVIWYTCPATPRLDNKKMLDSFEKEFTKNWTNDYIKEYVKYHKLNQPKKYSKDKFKIIREVRWD